MTVTANGFLATDFADRRAALALRFQELVGGNVATDEGTVEGDLITTAALAAQRLEEQLVLTYASAFLRSAAGALLDLVAEPIVGQRTRAASSVAAAVPLSGTPATVIPAGSAILPAGSDVAWVLESEVTLNGGGTGVGDFAAASTGSIAAIAGTTWTISTPVAGWSTVGPSATDAVLGNDEEADDAYRRRAIEAQRGGQIVREVWRVPGVTLVSVMENASDILDVEWGQTHWAELLVVGGTDAAIGAAIHASRAPGISTQGNTSVVIPVTDFVGGDLTVKFSRAVEVEVFVSVAVTKGEGYPASTGADAVAARVTAIKNAILTMAATTYVPGADVVSGQVFVAAFPAIVGIKSLTVLVDTISTPADTEVVIGVREVAVMAAVRITVSGA